ncbi:MAG: hypothetical protein JW709_01275 [Sedimentisphaerales bacterium]|nr:hypothetical protein [Sedimentisphaerales bacterium]
MMIMIVTDAAMEVVENAPIVEGRVSVIVTSAVRKQVWIHLVAIGLFARLAVVQVAGKGVIGCFVLTVMEPENATVMNVVMMRGSILPVATK